MAFRYVGGDRNQLFLMPVSMHDWLDEGHLAWFVLDVVERVDASAFHARYRLDGPGRPPYDPEMMLALLFYAYATGMRSSRRIEAACRTDAAFRVIAGGATPDHATIARFVVEHQAAIEAVFVDVLRLCAAAGLVSAERVAIDGTKIGADAALDQNRGAGWIRAEVSRMVAEAVATDAAEDAQVGVLGFEDLPVELGTRAGRVARLEAALAQIEAEEQAERAATAEQAANARREAEQGRKVRGRKSSDPDVALARADAAHTVATARAQKAAARQAARVKRAARLDDELRRTEATLEAARIAAAHAPPATPAQLEAAAMAHREAEQGRKVGGAKSSDPHIALARAEGAHAVVTARAKQAAARRDTPSGRATRLDDQLRRAAAALEAARTADHPRPAKQATANVVDPESRIMNTSHGFIQGYNCQAAVNELQIVLAHRVTQDCGDVRQYEPMVAAARAVLDTVGVDDPIGLVLADAGYWSERNATLAGPPRLIATQKDWKQRRAARELGTTNGPPPQGASPLEAMEHTLRTPEGAAAYKTRSHTVEPVFANNKENRGYRRFRRRGLSAAASEWSLITTVHNLGKLFDHHRLAGTPLPVT
jgi:transposase